MLLTPDAATLSPTRLMVGAAVIGAVLTGTGTGIPIALRSASAPRIDLRAAIEGNQTRVPSLSIQEVHPPATAPAALIRALHDSSGLTWEQLARAIGVSRRSLHLWAAGGHLSADNFERISAMLRDVRGLAAHTSAARRALLLAPRGAQASIFDSWRTAEAHRGASVSADLPLEATVSN